MTTVLTIILAVLIALNIWLTISAFKFKKDASKKLRERIEEFNEATEMHLSELQGAKVRVEDAIAANAKIKKLYDKLLKEHEKLTKVYSELRDRYKDHPVQGDPHAEHQNPVNGGDVNVVNTTAGEKKAKNKTKKEASNSGHCPVVRRKHGVKKTVKT